MTDIVPVANFRTRLEAEVAGGFLQAASVPFMIDSQEGMLYGPLGNGATILVRAEDLEAARDALSSSPPTQPPKVVEITRVATAEEAARASAALTDAGIPTLTASASGQGGTHAVFVPAPLGARARRVLGQSRDV